MKEYFKLHADIDLDAIEYNLKLSHDVVPEGTKMIPVIKADGYGHGSREIAAVLENIEYVWGFAVAQAEEAFVLRKSGITKPILLLGGSFHDVHEEMVSNDIRACVSSLEQAREVSNAAVKVGKKAILHVAVDTGMSRIGFQVNEESAKEVKAVAELPMVEIEGLFTHFARADEYDKKYALAQFDKYKTFAGMLEKEGVEIPFKHVSNSAAIFNHTELTMDAVRPGITLYGLTPSDEMTDVMKDKGIGYKPAMSIKSHIIYLKELEAGRAISYGGTYVTEKNTMVATIPCGYADGYPRLLSNKADVIIKGKRAPIIGRVCMDQFMVDVSQIPNVKTGDEVTLLGSDGDEMITAEELGNISGRFNYELVCDISKRVPRNYYKNGKLISQVDYF